MLLKLFLCTSLFFSALPTNPRREHHTFKEVINELFAENSNIEIIDNDTGLSIDKHSLIDLDYNAEATMADYLVNHNYSLVEILSTSQNKSASYRTESWTIYNPVRVSILGSTYYDVVIIAEVDYTVNNNKITNAYDHKIYLDYYNTYHSNNLRFDLSNRGLISKTGLNTRTLTLTWGYDINTYIAPSSFGEPDYFPEHVYQVYSTNHHITRISI